MRFQNANHRVQTRHRNHLPLIAEAVAVSVPDIPRALARRELRFRNFGKSEVGSASLLKREDRRHIDLPKFATLNSRAAKRHHNIPAIAPVAS
jgi:hypothetical protein